MRVLMISKALVAGAYQRKLELLAAQPGLELAAVVPPEWRDERGSLKLERVYTSGYRLIVEPMAFNGSFHLHYYPNIARHIAHLQPDIIHIDEEPYNLATWHIMRSARSGRARILFFSWQNLYRRYPFPFNLIESYVLRRADYAICGNQEAVNVWQAKGYDGPAAVIPQFGVDENLFAPAVMPARSHEPFTVCFAGRFVPEKGVDLLIQACARLEFDYRLVLIGAGPQRQALIELAGRCGVGSRLSVRPWAPSTEFPALLHSVDALVLPSVSRPNWKEQFGRVLIEAMACGVNVVGSTCGEIPHLIGEAGLVFPEGDVDALARALENLHADPALRAALLRKGRERVLTHYTQRRVAEATAQVYHQMLESPARGAPE